MENSAPALDRPRRWERYTLLLFFVGVLLFGEQFLRVVRVAAVQIHATRGPVFEEISRNEETRRVNRAIGRERERGATDEQHKE